LFKALAAWSLADSFWASLKPRSTPQQSMSFPHSTPDEVYAHLARNSDADQGTEVAARIAGLYCAQILATGFSGLIAAGVFAGMDGLRGLAGWRW
jgi:hypothetical protein